MCPKENNPTTNVFSCRIYYKVGFKNFGSLRRRNLKFGKNILLKVECMMEELAQH